MVHGFYDESRQLLFAANLGLNELDVISGQDFSVRARVPVPQPLGIDQMADGKTLVIGTEAQEIVTVDEDTFLVTAYPFSAAVDSAFSLFFPNVVAMANGKVFVIGQEQGVESSDILDGGQFLYEWDSNAHTFTPIDPTENGNVLETDSLARSTDHKWAVFSGDQFYLYSSDADSLTSVGLNTVNPPQNEFGVRGYAVNADGSLIAVASATQVTFLNNSLSVLASTPIPSAFQTARTAVQFSQDGSKLYLQYDLPVSIEVIDAMNFNAIGSYSGTVILDDDNLERMLATDSSGHAYIGIDEGLRIVDLTQPPVPNSTVNPNPYPCPVTSVVMPLGTPQQMQLPDTYKSLSVFIGGQPAPLLQGGTAISIPASSVAGPADVVCTDIYGNTAVVPDGVSYGVQLVGFSANLLPPSGNPSAYLFAYGLFSPPFGPPSSVSLGGQSALNVTRLSDVGLVGPEGDDFGLGALEGEVLQVPNGSSSSSVAIEATSSLGAGTLTSATSYYASPTIIPASGILQLTFDSHRSRLYALKATEVDVLDAASLQWLTPLKFPASASGTYDTMGLTPDGSTLVVGGLAAPPLQFIILDPDNKSPASTVSYANSSITFGSMAITQFNTVVMPGLVLDLATSTFSTFPYSGGQLIRASSDGSHLYSTVLNESSGQVASIDPSTYAVQSEGFGFMFWSDLAVSPDGSKFAAVDAPFGEIGDAIGFFNSNLQYINSNVYPDFSPPDDSGVLGVTYSPQGKVLVVPLGDSIELWDAAQGTLRARIMTPEELQKPPSTVGFESPMIAIDATGKTIYAASMSGITVLTLPQPLEQIAPMQWPEAHVSTLHTASRGLIATRMAAMRGKSQKGPRADLHER